MRIGLIGTENSHATQLVQALNVEGLHGPRRVSALMGPDPERNVQLSRLGSIARVLESASEMAAEVDAVIICDRHGDLHRPHAEPFLAVGLPVWIDKPLACSIADAEAIVKQAVDGGSPLLSGSALRWVPSTESVADALGEVGEVRAVQMSGPADPASEHGGIFFYGIHAADTALRFVSGEIEQVNSRRSQDLVQVNAVVAGADVSLTLIRPGAEARTPFHLRVIGTRGVLSRRIVLGPDYGANGLDRFFRMIASGHWPVGPVDLVRPISLLAKVHRDLAVAG